MDIDEQRARGAAIMAARNVAIAMERFGYKPPVRAQAYGTTAPSAPKPAPVPAAPTVDPAELARLTALAAVNVQERLASQRAEEAKASMRRVVAKINAQHGFKPEESQPELKGWAKVVARMNASANPSSAGRGPAPR